MKTALETYKTLTDKAEARRYYDAVVNLIDQADLDELNSLCTEDASDLDYLEMLEAFYEQKYNEKLYC